jgi:hypothetical protein
MRVDNIFPIALARFTIDKEIIDNTTFLVKKFIKDTNFADNPTPGELITTFYKNKDNYCL